MGKKSEKNLTCKYKIKEDSKKQPSEVTKRVLSEIVVKNVSSTDPYGSYTGKPVNHWEKPVQDADDL